MPLNWTLQNKQYLKYHGCSLKNGGIRALIGGVWPEDQRIPKSHSYNNLGSLMGVGVPEQDMYTKETGGVYNHSLLLVELVPQ